MKPSSATKITPSVNARDTVINRFTDKSLDQLGAVELQVLLLDARSAISSSIVSALSTGIVPSNFPHFYSY